MSKCAGVEVCNCSIVCVSVGWLVGWSAGRSVGWLVGWLIGWCVYCCWLFISSCACKLAWSFVRARLHARVCVGYFVLVSFVCLVVVFVVVS